MIYARGGGSWGRYIITTVDPLACYNGYIMVPLSFLFRQVTFLGDVLCTMVASLQNVNSKFMEIGKNGILPDLNNVQQPELHLEEP